MKPSSMQELYVEQLKDLYDAENQIIKALPDMIEAASSPELKEVLNQHLEVTKTQATRLEEIFSKLGEKPKGDKCKGMQGVLQEGSDLVEDIDDTNVRDAAIIASAQRVEHYEMAGYGTARAFATLLDENDASRLLEQTLNEEKEADDKLTELSENINARASGKGVQSEKSRTGSRWKVA
jgi:ferritin-like metal-binding protein YciE